MHYGVKEDKVKLKKKVQGGVGKVEVDSWQRY